MKNHSCTPSNVDPGNLFNHRPSGQRKAVAGLLYFVLDTRPDVTSPEPFFHV